MWHLVTGYSLEASECWWRDLYIVRSLDWLFFTSFVRVVLSGLIFFGLRKPLPFDAVEDLRGICLFVEGIVLLLVFDVIKWNLGFCAMIVSF